VSTAGVGRDALTRAGRIRANTDRAVPRGDTMRGCDAILAAMAIESADEQLAALHVRRLANRHGCGPAGCPDPGAHEADTATAALVLDALELPAALNGHSEPEPGPQPRPRRAPLPRPRSLAWRDDAACAEGGMLTLFFGPDGERQGERETRERKAAKVCARCPVRAGCLDFAIGSYGQQGEKAGVWGGLGEEARQAEKRRRTRKGEIAA